MAWIAALYAVSEDLSGGVSWLHLTVVGALGEFIRIVPISIQGIGVRENIFLYLLSLGGADPETAFLIGAVGYAILSLTLLFMGAVAAVMDLK